MGGDLDQGIPTREDKFSNKHLDTKANEPKNANGLQSVTGFLKA
jgi:hypothetical protein